MAEHPRAARPIPWAVGACLVYAGLALAVALGPRLAIPFVRFPAFTFPRAEGATAVPYFLADGVPADIEDYTAFAGVGPDDVDVEHRGVACSVEHRLHEQKHWLRSNVAAPGSPPGPTRVELGLRILDLDADGLRETRRVDARGTARPVGAP